MVLLFYFIFLAMCPHLSTWRDRSSAPPHKCQHVHFEQRETLFMCTPPLLLLIITLARHAQAPIKCNSARLG